MVQKISKRPRLIFIKCFDLLLHLFNTNQTNQNVSNANLPKTNNSSPSLNSSNHSFNSPSTILNLSSPDLILSSFDLLDQNTISSSIIGYEIRAILE